MSMRRFLKDFSWLFLIQALNYSIVCFSYRALSQANVPISVGIDLFYAGLQFWVIKEIADGAKTRAAFLGYTLGSALGTYLGIQVSLMILGK